MRLLETELPGAFVVEPEPAEDERGFFARVFDAEVFAAAGLEARVLQCSVSFNRRRGTLRGMHFQAEPHTEAKLVRCTAGAIFDAIVDLRPGSGTYARWTAVELTAANHLGLYVPRGWAHGFLTLSDEAEVTYQIADPYVPEASRGIRWDDPDVGIDWPATPVVISDRDAALPLLPDLETAL